MPLANSRSCDTRLTGESAAGAMRTSFSRRSARFISASKERSARALNLSASGSLPGTSFGSWFAYV